MTQSAVTRDEDPLWGETFIRFWLAGTTANFGWQIQLVGASWLMIALHGTPQQVALVQTMVALPIMLLSIPGGAIADSIGQRSLVLAAQSFLLVVSVLLAACAYLDVLTPSLLLMCTFLIGCGRAIYYPGWVSRILELLPRQEVSRGIAANSSSLNLARTVGPAVGGLIVSVAGSFIAFVVNALANLSVIFVARKWPGRRRDQDLSAEPIGSAILAGLRYFALSPRLLRIATRSTLFNAAGSSILALLPLLTRDAIHGGASTYGLLLGAFGTGAMIGALLTNRLRRHFPVDSLLAGGHLVSATAMGLVAFATSPFVSAAAVFVAGLGWTLVQVPLSSALQISSPRWVAGRSNAIYQTCVFGGSALGSLVWGTLAGNPGLTVALLSAALVLVIGASLSLLLKIGELDGDRLDPRGGWTMPALELDLQPKSGPIVITVQYRIRDQDLPLFIEAMGKKRRNRMRDGARRWTLARDLQDPALWSERYWVATWEEARRLHSRRTVAGAEVIEFLRSLHQGEGLPGAHYELVREPSMASAPHEPLPTAPV